MLGRPSPHECPPVLPPFRLSSRLLINPNSYHLAHPPFSLGLVIFQVVVNELIQLRGSEGPRG